MTNSVTLRTDLEKFGLTKNQAKIYLLLIEHRELRIQEITKLAKIPRSSVYENLKGLFELGIAEEVIRDSFKIIRPYSLGAMHHGIDEKMVRLNRLKSDLNDLEEEIVVSRPEHIPGTTTVRYYKNRSGARQLYWNTLRAQDRVYVYSDWGRGRYVGMRFYEGFVEESRTRKIKEHVLINATTATIKSIKEFTHPDSAISRTNLEDIRVLDAKGVSIKGDTLIYDNTYACVYLKSVEINGFEVESQQFVETQRAIFETLWKTAEPITKFL